MTLAPCPEKLVTMVRAMMPRTSSMIAAPRMAVPTRERSRPSSRRVWTVMLTEVAVRMMPMKMFCNSTPWAEAMPLMAMTLG